jgi:cysteine protease ATG4
VAGTVAVAHDDVPISWILGLRGLSDHEILPHIPWCTYRYGFPPLALTTEQGMNSSTRSPAITSDAGWGCMLRSGQMLLATALLHHHGALAPGLGVSSELEEMKRRRDEVLALFTDHPTAPYSIHNIAKAGHFYLGISPGAWYGPASIAHALQHCNVPGIVSPDLRVVVGGDGTLFHQPIRDALQQGCAVLALLPQRVGLGPHCNPVYLPALRACLACPWSVGIAGGRPNASLYFVGTTFPDLLDQGEGEVVYLDPHLSQRTTLPTTWTPSDGVPSDHWDSYVNRGPGRRMSWTGLDPSLVLAFYLRDLQELDAFLSWCIPVRAPSPYLDGAVFYKLT